MQTFEPTAGQREALRLASPSQLIALVQDSLCNFVPSNPVTEACSADPWLQVSVNEAAAQICRFMPALLTRRDELFPLARQVVRDSGYHYSKGHSK